MREEAKGIYNAIEQANRFKLVLKFLNENEDLENELGNKGVEWPREECIVEEFFDKLNEKQAQLVIDTFKMIAAQQK